MLADPIEKRCLRRAIRLWLSAMFTIFLAASPLHAYRVAVFDFDDRLEQEYTVAKHIEQRLKDADPEIHVMQFSGKGNEAHSIHVLMSLDQAGYDLIITITSDALILAKHTLTRTPVLYTNVNNPLSLGFKTLGPAGGNISGASYYVPIEKQIELYKEIQPDLKTIGLLFDRYNKSRKVELPEARNACKEAGITYEIEIIEEKDDLIPGVTRLLHSEVEAIVATSSDRVYNNIGEFLDFCNNAGVPIYSFNKAGVLRGAVAALASDYYRMVDELILPMSLKVLRDKVSPGSMPAAFLTGNVVYLNTSQMERLKLKVPEKIYEKAVLVE